MTAGRYKHSRDSIGQARQQKAAAKRDAIAAAQLTRRREQRLTQRALKTKDCK